jgi:hypothetical protein
MGGGQIFCCPPACRRPAAAAAAAAAAATATFLGLAARGPRRRLAHLEHQAWFALADMLLFCLVSN